MILQILSFLLLLTLVVAVPFLITSRGGLFQQRSLGNWISQPAAPRRFGIRLIECVLLTVMATSILLLLIFEQSDLEHVPALLSDKTATNVRTTIAIGVGIGVITIVVATIMAMRRSTTSAAMVLGGVFAFGSLAVNIVRSEQQTAAFQERDSIDKLPMLQFRVADCPDGAEVLINGVPIGTSPFTISVPDLFSQIPIWSYDDCREQNQLDEDAGHIAGRKKPLYNRWEGESLGLHRKQLAAFHSKDVFVTADYAGMKGFARFATTRDNSDGIRIVTLHVQFPRWEEEIEQLLDRARMQGYRPSGDWFKSFESYGTHAWTRLYELSRTEPEILVLLDEWAKLKYGLDDITTSSVSLTTLSRICNEVVTSGDHAYDSRSPQGRAVDLLTPAVDVTELVEFAKNLSDQPSPRSYGHSINEGPRPWFSFEIDTRVGNTQFLGLMPVVQALWMKDRELGEADSENPIEQAFTPLLLRRHRLKEAILLGGPVTEKYLQRQNWRAPADDFGTSVSVGLHENQVNKWFMALSRLETDAGYEFRKQHAGDLLNVARQAFGPFNLDDSSVPDELDFLFIDVPSPDYAPSLAKRFWPEFDRMLKNDDAALSMRWDYLGKMWPDSTPEMFATAFAQTDSESFWATLPGSMSPADRFAVYFAVYETLENMLAESPSSGRTGRHLEKIRRELEAIPHAAAAAMFVVRYEEGKYPFTTDHLKEQIRFDTTRHQHVEQLAAHHNPEFRIAALGAIRHHPIPSRLKLLEELEQDSNTNVKSAAQTVRDELDALLTAELKTRQP